MEDVDGKGGDDGQTSSSRRASQLRLHHAPDREGHARRDGSAGRGTVRGPDRARHRELPDQRMAAAAEVSGDACSGQRGVCARQRRARPAAAQDGLRDRSRGRRGRRRLPPRSVPGRRVPDRVGHLDEHEHERGSGPPRQPPSRGRPCRAPPGPPERPRQPRPVFERCHTGDAPHRGLARLARRGAPRDREGRGRTDVPRRRAPSNGDSWPHTPHGCRADYVRARFRSVGGPAARVSPVRRRRGPSATRHR